MSTKTVKVVGKTKVVRKTSSPAEKKAVPPQEGKTIEASSSPKIEEKKASRSFSGTQGVLMEKKIQTAQGWKRELKKLQEKKRSNPTK